MRCFSVDASFWGETLYTDIDLAPFMPDEDENFGASLVLDFKIWWRHVQAKIFLSWTREDKIHIHKRACNILFIT